ncbi:MAG: flagellar biosynthetic protein FliO [Clostridiales bacterium]|nr:flagellar biosynthetic protein FliO [Clostridiales bacterium]
MRPAQIVTFIIGCVVIIFGAYFATYLLAKGSQKAYRGRLIQVLDRFSLAKDKSLVLLAVYDKIYLVAFAAGSVTLLDNIDPQLAAAFSGQAAKPQNKIWPPGNISALLLGSLRNVWARKGVKLKPGEQIPYEAYLPVESGNKDTESFLSIFLKQKGFGEDSLK